MLKENFLTFPNAVGFPEGPYDLDRIYYSVKEDGTFELDLQLGWVYDIYLLRILSGKKTSWDLIHEDSAVVHIDARKIADNLSFVYKEFSIPCDIQLIIPMPDKILQGRATNLKFLPASSELGFLVALNLESGENVGLCSLGWKIINDTSIDDGWPSKNWKDWNTM